MKERFKTLKSELDKLIKEKIDCIDIANIVSNYFVEAYDVYDVGNFEKWQCWWNGKMDYKGKTLSICGCAFDGRIVIENFCKED